jgi:hypothetical protein
MSVKASSNYKQYSASKQHGAVTIEPGFDAVGGIVASNRRQWNADQHGGDALVGDAAMLAALRPRARKQMIDDSLRYTSAYRNVDWARGRMAAMDPELPLVFMAGHQPTLFHPGVWFKNFALSHLGAVHGAVPINLVIDNDVAVGSSIRVPTTAGDEVRRATVAYDTGGGGVPFEQTTIKDLETFNQFDVAVSKASRGLVDDPCIKSLWKHAKEAVARCGVAGCALAQARHALEGDVGLRTLELPLGVLCRGSAYAEFLLTILVDLPRFQTCYNQQTDHYRAAHHIRSSAHPVPHLESNGQWHEAPLWVYGNDSPARRPVWVKRDGDQITLTDSPPDLRRNDSGRAMETDRSLTIDIGHRKLAAEQLANLVDPNFKLRPRALITTMYARLVLSDLFLHGIGGGKYDQLGDRIIGAFYNVTPPEFMVISATVLLPQARIGPREQDSSEAEPPTKEPAIVKDATLLVKSLKRQIRDSVYQPERFADRADLDMSLVEQKRRLLMELPPDDSSRDEPSDNGPVNRKAASVTAKKHWHDRVTKINQQLSLQLADLRRDLEQQLHVAERGQWNESILASREHPFCVFALDDLVNTYRDLLA